MPDVPGQKVRGPAPQGGVEDQLILQGELSAGPDELRVTIILATGEPVVTIGGYKSRDPYPTVAELQSQIASGELKYVLLTSSSSAKAAGSSSDSARETLQALTDWVKANGTVVDASEYGGSSSGTLYYLGG